MAIYVAATRVFLLTGTGPETAGTGRFQTAPIQNLKFEFKKMKNSQKIPKNTSSCDESNGVKKF